MTVNRFFGWPIINVDGAWMFRFQDHFNQYYNCKYFSTWLMSKKNVNGQATFRTVQVTGGTSSTVEQVAQLFPAGWSSSLGRCYVL
jgi:hypothetical protein